MGEHTTRTEYRPMKPVRLSAREVANQHLLARVFNLLNAIPDDATETQCFAFMGSVRDALAERGRHITNTRVDTETAERYDRIADHAGIRWMTSVQRLHWLLMSVADLSDPGLLDLVAEILADAGMPDLPANAVAYAGNGTVQFIIAPNHYTPNTSATVVRMPAVDFERMCPFTPPHMPRIVHNIVTTAAGVQVRDSLAWRPVTPPPFDAPQSRPRLSDAVTARIRRGLERFFEDID